MRKHNLREALASITADPCLVQPCRVRRRARGEPRVGQAWVARPSYGDFHRPARKHLQWSFSRGAGNGQVAGKQQRNVAAAVAASAQLARPAFAANPEPLLWRRGRHARRVAFDRRGHRRRAPFDPVVLGYVRNGSLTRLGDAQLPARRFGPPRAFAGQGHTTGFPCAAASNTTRR